MVIAMMKRVQQNSSPLIYKGFGFVFFCCFANASYDSGYSYSLVDEPLGATGTYHSCLPCWHEFLWQKCLEKYPEWHAEYECADCNRCDCFIFYSLYGSLTGQAEQYMFYETTATIITLVFWGIILNMHRLLPHNGS